MQYRVPTLQNSTEQQTIQYRTVYFAQYRDRILRQNPYKSHHNHSTEYIPHMAIKSKHNTVCYRVSSIQYFNRIHANSSITVQSTHLIYITKDTQHRIIQSTYHIIQYRVQTTVQNTVQSKHYAVRIKPHPTRRSTQNTHFRTIQSTRYSVHTIQSTHYTVKHRAHTTQSNSEHTS